MARLQGEEMNKLSDYDLQRGDRVKLNGEWYEFFKMFDGAYFFYDKDYEALSKVEVEAALRPSFILREQLDDILKTQQTFSDRQYYRQYPIDWEIIHPRKEEKKSLEKELREVYANPSMPLREVLFKIAAVVDKLKEAVEKK